MPETNLLNKDGCKFTAKIMDDKVEGEIVVEDGRVFLAQNTQDGTSCRDRRGYKYSWVVDSGSSSHLTNNSVSCFSLDESPMTFKEGDRVKVKDSITTFAHGGHSELKTRYGTVKSPPNSDGTYMRVIFDDDHDYNMDAWEMEHTTVNKPEVAKIRACYFKNNDKVKLKPGITDFAYGGFQDHYKTGVVTDVRKWSEMKQCVEILVRWDVDGVRYSMSDDEFTLNNDIEPCYRDGQSFSAKIKGKYVEGKISIKADETVRTKDKVFLCQNEHNGSKAPDKKGYKYSWSIGWGMPDDMRRDSIRVTELKLDVPLKGETGPTPREPKFKPGDKVKVKPEHARSIVFGNFSLAHTGCVIEYSKFDEDKGDWRYIAEGGWALIEYQFELVTATATTGPTPPVPAWSRRFAVGAKLQPKSGVDCTAYGGNASYFVGCVVDSWEWDDVKHDWKYTVTSEKHGSNLKIKESEFELYRASEPKRPEPKFKAGQVVCSKSGIGRMAYGGNPSEFRDAKIMHRSDYPVWSVGNGCYDYVVKTDRVEGFIISEKDFELKDPTSARFETRLSHDPFETIRIDGDPGSWIDPKITKEPDLTFKSGPKKFSL